MIMHGKILNRLEAVGGLLCLIMTRLLICPVFKILCDQGVWLICEKRDEARDNGFHLFRFICENHPEVNACYVIDKSSPDFPRVKNIGTVVQANSLKHCILFLTAHYSISSQAYGAFPFKLNKKLLKVAQQLVNKNQRTVFLQHGIIKDELSHDAFDYGKCNIDFFVTSAEREYRFVKERYNYPDNAIGCIGLCRFDSLSSANVKCERKILIMPTWRMWLAAADHAMRATKQETQKFIKSDFYIHYRKLLSDIRIKSLCKKNNYKLVFYLHYGLQPYSSCFDDLASETVEIARQGESDVQDLLIRSHVLITDYSSVFFDFAYMDKPLIYYQFDRYRYRNSHYSEGYFDYVKDGFGPCCESENDLVDALESLFAVNCQQPDLYHMRANEFFTVRDEHNCERTFAAIMGLGGL